MFAASYTCNAGKDIGRSSGQLNPNITNAGRNFVIGAAGRAQHAQSGLKASTRIQSGILAEEIDRRAGNATKSKDSCCRKCKTARGRKVIVRAGSHISQRTSEIPGL